MLIKINERLKKNNFLRNVGVLLSGTVVGQVLAVISAPLLTRLYSPEDFGLFAVYAGLLSIFTIIASMRYELAIPLPEDDQTAADIVVLSLTIVMCTSIISALFVFFFGDWLVMKIGVPALGNKIWLLPLGVVFIGLYQVLNFWCIRKKRFFDIGQTRIKQSTTTVIIQLLGSKFGSVTLIIGHTIGQFIGGGVLVRSALSYPEFRKIKQVRFKEIAMRYKQFPIYSTFSGLFNEAGQQLPTLMFASLFSPAAAGLYALTRRVLAMPMTMIGSAVANVFLSNAADAYREGRIASLVELIHNKLAHIAMPPVIVLIAAGPDIFSLLFGEHWEEAGVFARWMAPWLYIVFITSPLSCLFEVMEKQKHGAVLQCILLAVRLVAILIGSYLGNILYAVILFSISSAFCWIGFLIWVMVNTGNSIIKILEVTIRSMLIGIVCVFPLEIISKIQVNHSFLMGLSISMLVILVRYFILFKEGLVGSDSN